MAYPGALDIYTPVQGTSTLAGADHANMHNLAGSAVVNIETTLGTTAGTSVLKNFAAGDFASRINGSNVLQQALQGTVNNSVLGTPAITGGTVNTVVMGTPTITGGKIATSLNDTNGNEVIKTPATASAINEVTITNSAIGSPVEVSATGDDTNISLKMTPKGTGVFQPKTSARARAYRATAQTLADNTATKIQLVTESYDPGSNFDNATNYRFTAPVTGYYDIRAQIGYASGVANTGRLVYVYINGAEAGMGVGHASVNSFDVTASYSDIVLLTAGDYVEMYGLQKSGGNLDTLAVANRTFLAIHLLSV